MLNPNKSTLRIHISLPINGTINDIRNAICREIVDEMTWGNVEHVMALTALLLTIKD